MDTMQINYARKVGEQQKAEVKTIRTRTLELDLSDADVRRISEKAGACGLTVANLIENFIGDLICGTYSNGSDERMYANQWFERCGFRFCYENNFLTYLIGINGLDCVLDNWDEMQRQKAELADMEANPEDLDPDDKEYALEEIKYCSEEIDGYWQEYAERESTAHGTLDDEMKAVLEWRERYKQLLTPPADTVSAQ